GVAHGVFLGRFTTDSHRDPPLTPESNQFAVVYETSPVSYHAAPIIFCRTGFVPLRLQVTEREIRIIRSNQNPDPPAQDITNTSNGSARERHRQRHDPTILQ